MATVAMVYNPIPEDRARWANPAGKRPPWQARYLAGLEGQATLGEPLRRQAAQVGMDRAERWIALSDGGAGLEDWLRANFGRVEAVILDFYHAAEHLGDLAKAWHGAGTEAAEARHDDWSHRLKHEGGRRCWRSCARWTAGRGRRPARCGGRRWSTSRTRCIGWTTRGYVAKGGRSARARWRRRARRSSASG